MRTPHRRDISARQDLLGRELRQLFDDYTQEDMPQELQSLAAQLQAAFDGRGDEPADPPRNGKAEAGESLFGTPAKSTSDATPDTTPDGAEH